MVHNTELSAIEIVINGYTVTLLSTSTESSVVNKGAKHIVWSAVDNNTKDGNVHPTTISTTDGEDAGNGA